MTLLLAHFGVGLLTLLVMWFFDDDIEPIFTVSVILCGFLSPLIAMITISMFAVVKGCKAIARSQFFRRINETKIRIRGIMADAIFGKDKAQ